jgi:hypothetical protein
VIELADFMDNMFSEGDYVMFADSQGSLRIAKVRGIKPNGETFMISLELVEGKGMGKRRYSRYYHEYDFYKVDYTTKGDA